MTSSRSAASATVPAIGPWAESPEPAAVGTSPTVGFSPNTPQNEAGIRIEPAPSPPCAIPTTPAATAAAEPPDDPPAVRPWRHGLCAGPFTRFPDSPFQPYSDVVVLPTMTAPAARMRATSGESAPAISPWWTSDPMLVGTPATSTRSLMAIGMPASGPAVSAAWARSASAACPRARSGVRVTNAFSRVSSASIRSSASRATSTGERSWLRKLSIRPAVVTPSACRPRPVRPHRRTVREP